MTDTAPPRRIAPQTGAHLWTGPALSPADWMVPLGSDAEAEILAALHAPGAALPRLDPLLSRIADRLAHGQGFALLRGLPLPEEPASLLGLLGSRIGRPLSLPEPGGPFYTEPCDALLLLCRQSVEVTLVSAAALHNELLRSDRAALDVLYRPLPHGPQAEGGSDLALPVFAVSSGVFAARFDRAALDPAAAGGALSVLEAAAASPELVLKLPLRPGDLLCVNPFLVWARRAAGLASLPLRSETSRLADSPFAALCTAEA
jgi:hypothetical protein